MKSGNLNFLEHSGPLQARNGTALLFFTYISTRLSVWGMYVLKYIHHWGLNFEFQSNRQREYITDPKINKNCQLFEINVNNFITKQYQYYSNISPEGSKAVLNCCLTDAFTVTVRCLLCCVDFCASLRVLQLLFLIKIKT
jgi:hypothetical protein